MSRIKFKALTEKQLDYILRLVHGRLKANNQPVFVTKELLVNVLNGNYSENHFVHQAILAELKPYQLKGSLDTELVKLS